MSDEKKKTLGTRKPLGVRTTVDVGKVQQQFSHGRKKSVVVERKRRLIKKPGEDAPASEAKEAAPPPAPAPAPKPAPAPTRKKSEADEVLSRKEMQEKLLREAEEERLRLAEEARRREEVAKTSQVEDQARREKENREREEAEAEARAADEARLQAEAEAAKAEAKQEHTPAARDKAPREKPQRKDAPKPPRGGRDKRRSGKLTVSRALAGEEGGRSRSLAALRRAREKEKRAHQFDPSEAKKQVRDVVVPEAITVQELANRMAEKGADLVKALFKMGLTATINQTIDQDTAELLVTEFGHNIKRVSESDVELGLEGAEDDEKDLEPRPPVVTIMGHVDHGKTSLLDALRGTDITAGEAGGITQHIGAYQVTPKGSGPITFLDTPGHEAFTEMRSRGANVTDIVILVVAADDGLMPQTIEAINHTKAAEVPMIVAINKIDKDGANPQKVRERLLEHEVIVESMSGDVQDVEVSALEKTNLDKLIEAVNLQAELLELKANPAREAEGNVIEAKLDKGRGPVATVLVNRGTLKRGDIFVVGAEWGKVRALVDDHGKQVKKAGPSKPVEVLGLSGTPMAGDAFTVVENEARAREVADYRANEMKKKRTATAPQSLENMFSAMANPAESFPVVIKGDVQGSVEAIISSLSGLSTEDIEVRVLHSGVGGITESDVTLAAASNAPIIGFNVRPNAKAREVAEQKGVELRYYDVIYDLIDETKAAMAGQLGPERIENIVGRAEVKEVFQAGKTGKAAGLLVTDGVIRLGINTRLMRDDTIIYKGSVASLRRFKDDVKEVKAGLECGVVFDDFKDVKPGDYLETFEVEERDRTL